jgi:L-fuculose-phosphate aldolase
MLLQEERQNVVEYCRKLDAGGLTTGTGGNISIFNAKEGLMAISPSSLDYGEMTAEDVVVMDLDANVIDSDLRPSSEFGMHLTCYKNRQDIKAVVHTHSPKATTLAVMGWDLPAVHYMIALSGGATIRCTPYRLFGTMELAEEALKALEGSFACLLGNHGTLATGPDIGYAYSLAEHTEFCADIYLRAKTIGEPNILSDEQISEVIEKFLSSYSSQKK